MDQSGQPHFVLCSSEFQVCVFAAMQLTFQNLPEVASTLKFQILLVLDQSVANHILPWSPTDLHVHCQLMFPKFVIEAILRDYRFCILLVQDQSGQSQFALCATCFGSTNIPSSVPKLNQPMHETRSMAHSQSAPCPGAKMMGSTLTLGMMVMIACTVLNFTLQSCILHTSRFIIARWNGQLHITPG